MWSLLGYSNTPEEETKPSDSDEKAPEEQPPAPEGPPATPTTGGGGIWSWFGYDETPAERETAPQVGFFVKVQQHVIHDAVSFPVAFEGHINAAEPPA
ncbi:hypothetical protein cyc_00859 [Cyclospora cayetanensis]|uniref:Uncharacterized protein n=1 Tax=Cyclospora cayetanensis TaxID=88456 RepID=A0A1D3CUS8_9EIME|nr:hypothetical protein cyc_00859 [Cyclospora cayetanensis]